MPEIMVTDHDRAMAFWTGVLGFRICYTRPALKFVYVEGPEGGPREFLVQEPEGYLVMVAQRIGEKPKP